MIIADVLTEAKAILSPEGYSPSDDAHLKRVIARLVDVVGTLTATETDYIELPKDHVFTPAQAEARKRWALEFVPKLAGAARGLGYGVFQGGTLVRDIDLIAVPWRSDCVTPVEFVVELCMCMTLQMGNHGKTISGHQWFALWDRAHRDHQIDLKVIGPAK